MKKTLLLLVMVCFIACNTNNQQNNNATDASDSTDSIEVEGIVDVTEAPEVEDTEITLDFSSYHLYTCEDDKYDASGYQPVSAKVTIDEENKKASLKLYDNGENRWYPYYFRIAKKLYLQEGVITYIVYDNANQKGYIYISTNLPGGVFIDISNFEFGGDGICCWMQEGGSSGSQYREDVTIQSTPNTNPSNPLFSPVLRSGSLHSDERISDDFYYYKETYDCVEGLVVYEGSGDYYIVETRKGYTVLERYSGSLYEGDKVRGELNRYNFKYIINRDRSSEVRVYIEDNRLSANDALEWLGEKNHLKYDDQSAYDANN